MKIVLPYHNLNNYLIPTASCYSCDNLNTKLYTGILVKKLYIAHQKWVQKLKGTKYHLNSSDKTPYF